MYGTDGESASDSEPDLVIIGLLSEHQSHPVTMKEVPFFAWYSVALTQFRVPWISAKAPRGTTLYLHCVLYLSSVRRYSPWRVTVKRTCYIHHMTSVLMLFLFLNVALSPWLLILPPISLRMHAAQKGFDPESIGVQGCWIWRRSQGVLATPFYSHSSPSSTLIVPLVPLILCAFINSYNTYKVSF